MRTLDSLQDATRSRLRTLEEEVGLLVDSFDALRLRGGACMLTAALEK